jgi:hypothetical protein
VNDFSLQRDINFSDFRIMYKKVHLRFLFDNILENTLINIK